MFSLTNLNNSLYDDKNDDVFYFMYNNLMDTLIAMWKSSYLYVEELQDRTNKVNEANTIVFYCSIAAMIVSVFLLIPVVFVVKQNQIEIFGIIP